MLINRNNHSGLFVAIVLSVAVGSAGKLFADPPATQPSSQQDVYAELAAARREFKVFISNPESGKWLRTEQWRKDNAPRIIALISKIRQLEELTQLIAPPAGSVRRLSTQAVIFDEVKYDQFMVALGDAETIGALKKKAQADNAEALRAKASLAAGSYFSAATEAGQLAALEDFSKVYIAADGNNPAVDITYVFLNLSPAPSESAKTRIERMASEAKPGQFTQTVMRQKNGDDLMKNAERKPIVLAGTTVEGRQFSTADWKGKVILVDFWATWCGPCKAELPRLKEIYKKYHDQGLEVLGISNDRSKSALTSYLAKDPELSWTQLFEEPKGESDSHPLTMKYGITGIPRMFLIDRQGVLYTVDARSNYEELIPRLLAGETAVKTSVKSNKLQ